MKRLITVILMSLMVQTTYHQNYSGPLKQQALGFSVPLFDAGLVGYSHKLRIAYLNPSFEVVLSTTTSMLWIPHINCTTDACENKNKFDPSNSRSFVADAKTWYSETFGASGLLGSDTIVASVTDGALGLGFQSDPGSNSSSFVSQARTKGYLYDSMFTVYLKSPTELGAEAGVITYGSEDPDNCPAIHYHRLSSYTSYRFQINAISLGRIYYPKKFEVVQDLHRFIMGPYYIIAQLAITAGAEYDEGCYWIECNATFPSLEIEIDSIKYYISSDKLILQNGTTCMLAMKHMRRDIVLDHDWSFGAPFIQAHCVTFDFGRKRLGISRL